MSVHTLYAMVLVAALVQSAIAPFAAPSAAGAAPGAGSASTAPAAPAGEDLSTDELRARAAYWKERYADRLRAESAAKPFLRRTLDNMARSLPLTAVAWTWFVVGFIGQFTFGMRFVVQWIVTERRKESTIPLAFWYLSLAGTIVLLVYAIHREDWVFIAGFSLNMVIYLRNLYFIHGKPKGRPQGASAR